MLTSYVILLICKDNWSFSLLPTENSKTLLGGTLSFWRYPNKYNFESVDNPAVISTSNVNQLKFEGFVNFFWGADISTINPLSSFKNASSLNLSASRAVSPKLELELVIDASPPDSAKKCLL